MLDQKNSRKQGDVGLGIAIGWFATQGYTVCVPLTDSQDYDLVVEFTGEGLKKVQVKTTKAKNPEDNYRVELRTRGGNKTGTGRTKHWGEVDCDYLFIVTADNEKYLIPKEDTLHIKSEISLGKQKDLYKVA